MARAAAVTLALVPAGAAWGLLMTLDFEGVVVLGTLALLGGIWTLAQPLTRSLRLAVAGFALVTLLGTTGLRMGGLAAGVRPFSLWNDLQQKDLVDLTVPVASEGEFFDKLDAQRAILSLDRYGGIPWRGVYKSLSEIDGILDHVAGIDEIRGQPLATEILIRCDKDSPFLHFGWLALAAAAKGHRVVSVAVDKFARSVESAREVCAEQSREYWPELYLSFPIGSAEGARLRIAVTDWKEGVWGPPGAQVLVRMATGFRYELEGRATADLREALGWVRERPPAAIQCDPAVPIKLAIAVENELRKAGHPPAALVLPDPPPEAVKKARFLPYPLAK